jgi:2-oxoisovalerate dehydrogenase E1 component alpha subunit
MRAAKPAPPDGISRELQLAMYRNMLLQRAVDTRGFQLNRQGKIPIAMGSEGHEAVQAGTGAAFVRGRDLLYPYYRNTGLLLACGYPLEDVFRSQFARATDRSKGRSIINHISGGDLGIATISSIIAAQLTHAVGAAFALRAEGARDRVVFAQLGDGATSEGECHEAFNFAAVQELPVVFVCENNQWAISTPISKQMRIPDIHRRAAAYGMRGVVCDGFDPVAVYTAVHDARAATAAGGGPVLVEAKCYRFLSHTTDDDETTYRTRDEVEAQRNSDPVPRFKARLIAAGILDPESAAALERDVLHTVDATTDRIEAEPLPAAADLYGNVYEGSEEPWV